MSPPRPATAPRPPPRTLGRLAALVLADLGIVAGWTLAVGATAPRWPADWLTRDRGPLRLTALDAPRVYRRLGVDRWARTLPEWGGVFGISKRSLPGRTPEQLAGYLVEVRRAEWVHWLSLLSLVPVVRLGPRWLAALFVSVAGVVNVPFLAILRFNRVRLLRVLARRRPAGPSRTPCRAPAATTTPR